MQYAWCFILHSPGIAESLVHSYGKYMAVLSTRLSTLTSYNRVVRWRWRIRCNIHFTSAPSYVCLKSRKQPSPRALSLKYTYSGKMYRFCFTCNLLRLLCTYSHPKNYLWHANLTRVVVKMCSRVYKNVLCNTFCLTLLRVAQIMIMLSARIDVWCFYLQFQAFCETFYYDSKFSVKHGTSSTDCKWEN